MHTGRRGDRVLGLVRVAGLLVLLGGSVWLTVALIFQGVDRAGHWAPVLGTGVAIVGMLVTLVTSWLQQRSAEEELAGAQQVARVAEELRAALWEQWRREAEVRSLGDPDRSDAGALVVVRPGGDGPRRAHRSGPPRVCLAQ
jgi:hypothetical protein